MTPQRVYGLDLLRAVAILTVVQAHAYLLIKTHVDCHLYDSLTVDGVSIFFVLSGFLIGQILLRKIQSTPFSWRDLTEFWFRRWLRTLPAYYAILFILILHTAFMGGLADLKRYIPYGTFCQALWHPDTSLFTVSWSLCVEEWYYLLFPASLFIAMRIGAPSRPRVFISCAALLALFSISISAYRIVTLRIVDLESWQVNLRSVALTRFDSMAVGMFGAYLEDKQVGLWTRHRLAKLWAGMIILFGLNVSYYFTGFGLKDVLLTLYLESLATFLMLPWLSALKEGKGPVFAVTTFISVISYSIYLVHMSPFEAFILPLLGRVVPEAHTWPNDLVRLGAYLTWAFGGAYLLHRIVEKPFMDLRRILDTPATRGPVPLKPPGGT